MSEVRDNLVYTAEHEWVEQAGGSCKIGITDYAQAALGDIVYVQMPKIGDAVVLPTSTYRYQHSYI